MVRVTQAGPSGAKPGSQYFREARAGGVPARHSFAVMRYLK
jgi:hypothetical protein